MSGEEHPSEGLSIDQFALDRAPEAAELGTELGRSTLIDPTVVVAPGDGSRQILTAENHPHFCVRVATWRLTAENMRPCSLDIDAGYELPDELADAVDDFVERLYEVKRRRAEAEADRQLGQQLVDGFMAAKRRMDHLTTTLTRPQVAPTRYFATFFDPPRDYGVWRECVATLFGASTPVHDFPMQDESEWRG